MSRTLAITLDDLVACRSCDLLHLRKPLALGEQTRCRRCSSIMSTRKPATIDRSLAAVLASIVLLLISLMLPFLSLSRAGIESQISILDAVASLWESDLRWLGLVTLALIVLLPLGRLVLLAWVLAAIRLRRPANRALRSAFRWATRLEPWAMADVFMVGVAISLVKLGSVARLEIGLAFWSLCALIALTVIVTIVLCKDTVWRYLIQ